jgi:serine protease Do
VTAINGQRPANIVDAYALLLKSQADGHLLVTYAGAKAAETVACKAVPAPDAVVAARRVLGMTVEPLTPLLAEKYHVVADDGLFVSDVAKGGAAARAGVQPGDVVVQFGRYRVANLNDLGALIHRLPQSGRVRVGVLRGEQVGYGVLELGS